MGHGDAASEKRPMARHDRAGPRVGRLLLHSGVADLFDRPPRSVRWSCHIGPLGVRVRPRIRTVRLCGLAEEGAWREATVGSALGAARPANDGPANVSAAIATISVGNSVFLPHRFLSPFRGAV